MHELDYPAAHSMDTQWFAIDAQGHVGSFYTGESGALPTQCRGREPVLGDDLIVRFPRTNVLVDRDGHFMPNGSVGVADEWRERTVLLVFVTALEPFQHLIASGIAQQVPAVRDYALRWLVTGPADRELLRQSGVFRGWIYYDAYTYRANNHAAYGLYTFHHLTENWIAGPYGRSIVPEVPLHVDQLLPAVRRELKQTCFHELSFAELSLLNPAQYLPCEADDVVSGWLDSQGVRHPIIGHEADFVSDWNQMEEIG